MSRPLRTSRPMMPLVASEMATDTPTSRSAMRMVIEIATTGPFSMMNPTLPGVFGSDQVSGVGLVGNNRRGDSSHGGSDIVDQTEHQLQEVHDQPDRDRDSRRPHRNPDEPEPELPVLERDESAVGCDVDHPPDDGDHQKKPESVDHCPRTRRELAYEQGHGDVGSSTLSEAEAEEDDRNHHHLAELDHASDRLTEQRSPGYIRDDRHEHDHDAEDGEERPVSYTHLRAHETDSYLVCRLLLEKKKK